MDPLNDLGPTPTCPTCGTVVDGDICKTCERDVAQRRSSFAVVANPIGNWKIPNLVADLEPAYRAIADSARVYADQIEVIQGVVNDQITVSNEVWSALATQISESYLSRIKVSLPVATELASIGSTLFEHSRLIDSTAATLAAAIAEQTRLSMPTWIDDFMSSGQWEIASELVEDDIAVSSATAVIDSADEATLEALGTASDAIPDELRLEIFRRIARFTQRVQAARPTVTDRVARGVALITWRTGMIVMAAALGHIHAKAGPEAFVIATIMMAAIPSGRIEAHLSTPRPTGPLTRRCPRCKAAPGAGCVTVAGASPGTPTSRIHANR